MPARSIAIGFHARNENESKSRIFTRRLITTTSSCRYFTQKINVSCLQQRITRNHHKLRPLSGRRSPFDGPNVRGRRHEGGNVRPEPHARLRAQIVTMRALVIDERLFGCAAMRMSLARGAFEIELALYAHAGFLAPA
jgi:hypothetical protein